MFTKDDIGTLFFVKESFDKVFNIFDESKTNDILILVGFTGMDDKFNSQYLIYHFRLGKIFNWYYGNGGHTCFLKQVKMMR